MQRSDSTQIRLGVVRLLQKEQHQLLTYVYALTHDYHLAEDIFQEVSLIVAESPDRIPEDERHAHNWIKQIARRKALEIGRKDRSFKRWLSPGVIDLCFEEIDAEEDECGKQRHARMSECIGRLKQHSRTVVTARYLENLDCEEIASTIGRSVQSVYAILKRARLALAQCMHAHVRSE